MKLEKAGRRRVRNGRQSQTERPGHVSGAGVDPNHGGGQADGSTGQEHAAGGHAPTGQDTEHEQTKALQTAAPKPAESKGLQFATEGMSAAPKTWQGNAIHIAANKTREQFCGELCCEVEKAAGVPLEVADRMAHQMANALVWPKPKDENEYLIKAITALAEFAPKNSIEASLAAQMTATGEAALMFMERATRQDQGSEVIDLNVARATRLMRLHLEQVEAMQKLKGKAGQQKVTVEHVHVHEGGQAIVGAVSTTQGEGDGGK